MLYALGDPLALVALLLGFLTAVVAHGWAQARAAALLGDRSPLAQRRGSLDPRAHLDPFGCVAAALGGTGWPTPVEVDARRVGGGRSFGHRPARWRFLAALAAGPLLNLLLAAAALAGYLAVGGPRVLVGVQQLPDALHGDLVGSFAGAERVLLLVAMAQLGAGLLALVPLPPLPAGRVLFQLGPRSHGWQKAEYHLVEQNIGLVAVLVLLLIPLAGEGPLLLVLLDALAGPLLDLVG